MICFETSLSICSIALISVCLVSYNKNYVYVNYKEYYKIKCSFNNFELGSITYFYF